MADYITTILNQLGIPIWVFTIIMVWSTIWKMIALWKSARKGSAIWFVILALFNTVGILEILYIFAFSKINWCNTKKSKARKKIKPKKRKR